MKILTLLALALVSPVAFAQIQPGSGSYKLFTEGCPGTGGPGCYGANFQGGPLQPVLQQKGMEFAIRFDADAKTLVLGLQFWCKGSANGLRVPVSIYLANAAGAPLAKPVATATMAVTTRLAWYGVTFTKPFTLAKKQRAFAAFQVPTGSARLSPPAVLQGFRRTHFQRLPSKGPAWSRAKLAQNWAWRLRCAGAKVPAAPVLTGDAKGARIGKTFHLTLGVGPVKSPAFFVTGVSKKTWGPIPLPLDLKPAGAPGCQLLVSMDILAFVILDAQGTANLSFPIPNQLSLVKKSFHNQAVCLDTKANTLGLTLSNGGTALIGK